MLRRSSTAIVLGFGVFGHLTACSGAIPKFGDNSPDAATSASSDGDAGILDDASAASTDSSSGSNGSNGQSNVSQSVTDSVSSTTAADSVDSISDDTDETASVGEDASVDSKSSDDSDDSDANESDDSNDAGGSDVSNDRDGSDTSADFDASNGTTDASDSTRTDTATSATTDPQCQPDSKLSCAAVYGAEGQCGTYQLTCGANGTWPSESQCDARAATENCLTNGDENCDGDVNEAASCPCADNPCQNDGECVPTATSAYSCKCEAGYAGPNCESLGAREVDLPEGMSSCDPVGVSNDGAILAANCFDGEDSIGHFWNGGQGVSGTWRAAGKSPNYELAYVNAINADGTMAAGYYRDWDSTLIPVRWNSLSSVAVTLGSSILLDANATAMSSDGSVIAGVDASRNVLRWSGTSDPIAYTGIENGTLTSYRVPVSADGTAIASFGDSETGLVRWASQSAASNDLGVVMVEVAAISNDAKKVVGVASSPENPFIYVVFYYDDGEWNFFDAQGALSCRAFGADEGLSRILGSCSGVYYLWIDQAVFELQDIVTDSGSDVVFASPISSGAISKNGQFGLVPDTEKLIVVRLPD
jgi:hypothetical protein